MGQSACGVLHVLVMEINGECTDPAFRAVPEGAAIVRYGGA